MFREKQDVWNIYGEHGIVDDITAESEYPVYVHFDDGYDECYTADGKISIEDTLQSLFPHPVITLEIEPNPDYPYIRVDEGGDIYECKTPPNMTNSTWGGEASDFKFSDPKILNWKTAGIDLPQPKKQTYQYTLTDDEKKRVDETLSLTK